jgi:hypothetical protein
LKADARTPAHRTVWNRGAGTVAARRQSRESGSRSMESGSRSMATVPSLNGFFRVMRTRLTI